MRKTNLGVALACTGLLAGLALPAAGAEPTWGTTRDMTCDGQPLSAQFAPGGIFTAFHVDGSDDVIVIKHLEIQGYFAPGVWTTTLDVPGFSKNAVDTVHCEYVDPQGYPVRFEGLRS